MPQLKRGFLESLNYLGTLFHDQQWIIRGDFNMITSLLEKKGGVRRLDGESEVFRDWIEKFRLIDIPTSSGLFTWSNKRREDKQVTVILDIFLTSETMFQGQQCNFG
jgi:hypothetical protein